MKAINKDNYTVLFELKGNITGILICTHNSIELRIKLHKFTEKFYVQNRIFFENKNS